MYVMLGSRLICNLENPNPEQGEPARVTLSRGLFNGYLDRPTKKDHRISFADFAAENPTDAYELLLGVLGHLATRVKTAQTINHMGLSSDMDIPEAVDAAANTSFEKFQQELAKHQELGVAVYTIGIPPFRGAVRRVRGLRSSIGALTDQSDQRLITAFRVTPPTLIL
jgi:hypothetical protein